MIRRPPRSTLFPDTPLSRSAHANLEGKSGRERRAQGGDGSAERLARPQRAAAVSGRLLCCIDRKSTRLNSSHANISYAVFCLKKISNVTQQLQMIAARPTNP